MHARREASSKSHGTHPDTSRSPCAAGVAAGTGVPVRRGWEAGQCHDAWNHSPRPLGRDHHHGSPHYDLRGPPPTHGLHHPPVGGEWRGRRKTWAYARGERRGPARGLAASLIRPGQASRTPRWPPRRGGGRTGGGCARNGREGAARSAVGGATPNVQGATLNRVRRSRRLRYTPPGTAAPSGAIRSTEPGGGEYGGTTSRRA